MTKFKDCKTYNSEESIKQAGNLCKSIIAILAYVILFFKRE